VQNRRPTHTGLATDHQDSVGAQWPFISDSERIVQKDLDIQEYTDPDNDPMIPHTLVLKPRLVVHKIYNGYWFWGRPSFVDLWHDLRDVAREIRPDWDLDAPGLREAWDAGELVDLPRLGQAGRGKPERRLSDGSGGHASHDALRAGDGPRAVTGGARLDRARVLPAAVGGVEIAAMDERRAVESLVRVGTVVAAWSDGDLRRIGGARRSTAQPSAHQRIGPCRCWPTLDERFASLRGSVPSAPARTIVRRAWKKATSCRD
jgi:hypothetical protein